jgi:RNA recognition motif-containing protein
MLFPIVVRNHDGGSPPSTIGQSCKMLFQEKLTHRRLKRRRISSVPTIAPFVALWSLNMMTVPFARSWVINMVERPSAFWRTSSLTLRAVFTQPNFSGNGPSRNGSSEIIDAFTESRRSSSSDSSRPFPKADGRIVQDHLRRIRGAGRVGTKRFVDPCRVFVGNLNYTTTEKGLAEFVSSQLGLPTAICLRGVNVVRDWKAQTSKGYGFCVFSDPVHATVFIDKCRAGRGSLDGRTLTVAQGARKRHDNELYVVKKFNRAEAQDWEGRVISDALAQADDERAEEENEEELELLRLLDPDLVGRGDRLSNEERDGTSNRSNRAQRREAERGKKRNKPHSKGFG